MIAGLLFLVMMVVLVVLVVRRVGTHGAGASADGHTVRRVFEYALLYGLFVVVAIGLSGLLGRVFERDVLVTGDEAGLARELAFLVVGGPLFAGVALWSRRRFAADPGESRSLEWAFYVTAASLTALVVAMTGLGETLAWAIGLEDFSGFALAQVLVWGGAWGAHWWVDGRRTPPEHTGVHHFAGAFVGLVVSAVGLGLLLAGTFRVLFGLTGDELIGNDTDQLRAGAVVLVTGAPVWFLYWVRTASRRHEDLLWPVFVLLAGVAGGMITAVVSASTLLHSTLVWLVGDPGGVGAKVHFDAAPAQIAAALVGALVWWYHQALLRATAGAGVRTEVRRVYEYVLAGIGLLAAAGGLIMVVAALFEALAGSAMVGGDAVNALLAAATLLAVGGPVWWIYWHSAQAAAHAKPDEELRSPTRRVYLTMLFGVGGVAAVVALIVGVYLVLQDVVESTVGAETLRSVRFAVGVLLATAAITAYHWAVYRSDREHVPEAAEQHLPRFVLLVGPEGREVAREVAHRTHGRVQALVRADNGHTTWTADEVMAAIGDSTAEEVIVLAEPEGLRAIPFHR
ncbi:MAG: DUF5671 domain-containing protein [Nocardioides sp.]